MKIQYLQENPLEQAAIQCIRVHSAMCYIGVAMVFEWRCHDASNSRFPMLIQLNLVLAVYNILLFSYFKLAYF